MAACCKCLRCRCKIRGSGVLGDVRSCIVVRTCEIMKMVASATCFLESSKNRRFESLFHCPTFTHDMIRFVLFSLRFSFIQITSCQARTHCRSVTLRTVGFSRMQRFLMLSVFVATSVSHAVALFDRRRSRCEARSSGLHRDCFGARRCGGELSSAVSASFRSRGLF